MDHSSVDYWRRIQLLEPRHPDRPSARVCRLLDRAIERWRRRHPWLAEHDISLFDGCSEAQRMALAEEPMAVRKGMAIARMLELVTNVADIRPEGTFCIHPDELIVGTMPPFSVGQGKEVV